MFCPIRKVSINASADHRISRLHRRPTAFINDLATQKAIAEASRIKEKVDEEEHDEEYVLKGTTQELLA